MGKHKKEKRRNHSPESEHYKRTKIKQQRRSYSPKFRCSDEPSTSCRHDFHSQDNLSQDNDGEFNWEDHRRILNKMFFRDQDLIKKGSSKYDAFWLFLKKYQTKKSASTVNSKGNDGSSKAKPEFLNKINFRLRTGDLDDLKIRGGIFKDDTDANQLTDDRINEFSSVLHLFVDFLQKQNFGKLKKLREAQSNLPIAQFHEKIISAVRDNQLVLVAGDTGCGKSTQVPQYLLAAGFDRIACTQPRRIACISLSKRVAFETLNEYKDEVGYQIRFEKHKSQRTRILFLTEGLLLRQVTGDPLLSMYDVVILDEVHERHLSCDFLLGIVKCLTRERKDLKVVLMSATINVDLFSAYFDNCPVVQVPGRLYPIKVMYQPLGVEERKNRTGRLNPGPYIRILQQIDNKYPAEERGDLLIFLSGMAEISMVVEAAQTYAQQTKRWIILTLHSALSLDEQDKVFDYAPPGIRKCIVSTNIAETSVTIDGVRFVLDSGKVKEMSYDPSCRMEKLKEFWISRASAEQRKGRAGRTGPGICYRLYSETEYNDLIPYSTPEIQRVPLDSLLLQMISMGLPDARKFPFLEPPSLKCVEESIQGLKEQGALNEDEQLTPMGKMLASLPVDVTIGKMLVLGSVFDLLEPMLSLAAVLSVQSPLTNRAYKDIDAMAARKSLDSDHGDPFTLLNAFHEWMNLKSGSESQTSRKWCKRRGLEEQRFYEMTKIRRQFKDLLQESGLIEARKSGSGNSTERSMRHGELKMLREIKRDQHRTGPRRRKLLRLEAEIEGIADSDYDEDAPEGADLHDVDFRLSHNQKQIKDLTSTSHVHSYRALSLLKLVLCSGLYPQIALLDKHNLAKKDSEQLCHTRGKPYVLMHPMSVFALQPDLLALRDLDVVVRGDFNSRQSLSAKHQALFYMSLLETSKPYLINCVRVPAAHTLLLLSHQLDTNQDLTRIVCDSWIELRFPDPEAIQQILSYTISVRDLWDKQLREILQDSCQRNEEPVERTPECRRTQRHLMAQMEKLLMTEVIFTVRRLLPADLKDLYSGSLDGQMMCSLLSQSIPSEEDLKIHPVKGGLIVKEYFNYNCLFDVDVRQMIDLQPEWTCPGCSTSMQASVLEQVRHRQRCNALNPVASEVEEEAKSVRPNEKTYFCEDCQKELLLTAPEILRHRRNHALKEEAD